MQECNLHTIISLPNSAFRPYASIGANLPFFEKGGPTKETWFWQHRVPAGQKTYSMTKPTRLEHLQDCIEWRGGKDRKGQKETERAWMLTPEEVKTRGSNLNIKNPHTTPDGHGNPEKWLADLDAAKAETARLRAQLKPILVEAPIR